MNDRILRLVESVKTASPKRTLGVIALLIVTAAIPLTLTVMQRQQDTRTRASITNPFPEPTCTSILATPSAVLMGGNSAVSIDCSNAASFTWTVDCGSFTSASTAGPANQWTAPASTTSAACTITGNGCDSATCSASLSTSVTITNPLPTATPTPTLTPSPTINPRPTPVPGTTSLNLVLGLDSVGSTGDHVNPANSTGSNQNPLTQKRNIVVQIFDISNNSVDEINGEVNFKSGTGKFEGTVNLKSGFQSGAYTILVKTPRYLRRVYSGIQNITAGTLNDLPLLNMIVGDIVDNNAIDIQDYNVFISCSIFTKDNGGACSSGSTNYRPFSDLNDDGKVDENDYLFLLREWVVQFGDSGPSGCVDGALRCSLDQPQKCVNKNWQNNGAKCTGTTPVCSSGLCVGPTPTPVCTAPNTKCGTACVNLKTDSNNCNACGKKCTTGKICQNGLCKTGRPTPTIRPTASPTPTVCVSPKKICGTTCVSLQSDNNNCGTCGTKCTSGKVCQSGICKTVTTPTPTSACLAPRKLCGNSCVNIKTDKNNCGACAKKCSSSQTCQNGVCKSGGGGDDRDD